MKKILFFIISLLVFKNAYTQYFVTQRVKFVENWEKVLFDKKVSINYVEIRSMDNDVLFLVDSNDLVLVDANKIGDSLELFYKTSLDKIIVNKVKLSASEVLQTLLHIISIYNAKTIMPIK